MAPTAKRVVERRETLLDRMRALGEPRPTMFWLDYGLHRSSLAPDAQLYKDLLVLERQGAVRRHGQRGRGHRTTWSAT